VEVGGVTKRVTYGAQMGRRTPGPPKKVAEVVTRTDKPRKPGCPKHLCEMAFDLETMVWKCPEAGCTMVAYPKEDIEAGKSKPRIGRGLIELVKMDGHWFLRAPDNNVLIEVTSVRRRVSGTEVILQVNSVLELD
jgi:hypothetical protein